MRITVQRQTQDGVSTIGEMLIDGTHECWTLEPANPILAGTYDLIIDFSRHFQRLMLHVLNVPPCPPDRGIRIHWGNIAANTEGCTLVGETDGKDFVGKSVDEFNVLFGKIQDALQEGPVTITYVDPMSANVPSGAGGGD